MEIVVVTKIRTPPPLLPFVSDVFNEQPLSSLKITIFSSKLFFLYAFLKLSHYFRLGIRSHLLSSFRQLLMDHKFNAFDPLLSTLIKESD